MKMVLQTVEGRYISEKELKRVLGRLFPKQAKAGGFDIKVSVYCVFGSRSYPC